LTTDIRPNDCYALLAAHLIVDIAEDTDDHAVYWDAIGILEEALHYSPSNAQIKLLLVRLYSILGKYKHLNGPLQNDVMWHHEGNQSC
jgi:N-terminal acetyltransferase B complex non-catalytic subunit